MDAQLAFGMTVNAGLYHLRAGGGVASSSLRKYVSVRGPAHSSSDLHYRREIKANKGQAA